MAKKNEADIVDVEEVYSKTEEYIKKNQRPLTIGGIAIVAVVAIFFGYRYFYQLPLEAEANEAIWKAEQLFGEDSLRSAITGVEGNPALQIQPVQGFESIIENYSGTPAGNLAQLYAGISYLWLGQHDFAIELLEEYDIEEDMVGPLSLGTRGDAHMEKGETEKALELYLEGAEEAGEHNDLAAPYLLKKAAFASEELGKYKEAAALYKTIRNQYPDSELAQQVEKYQVRAELMAGN